MASSPESSGFGCPIPEQMVIPANSLVAGVPGKIRRTLGDADRELILKYARNYLDYTAIYLSERQGSVSNLDKS